MRKNLLNAAADWLVDLAGLFVEKLLAGQAVPSPPSALPLADARNGAERGTNGKRISAK